MRRAGLHADTLLHAEDLGRRVLGGLGHPTTPTLPAVAAEERGVHGDAVSGSDAGGDVGGYSRDGTGELVSWNQWIRAGRKLSGGDVQVGAADAACADVDDDLARSGGRLVGFLDADEVRFLDDGCLHGTSKFAQMSKKLAHMLISGVP
jgi:hypothetical protein